MRRKLFFNRTFVTLFLFHLLVCAGAFSGVSLCFEDDGSFHVEFSPCEKDLEKDGGRAAAGASGISRGFEYSPCGSCTDIRFLSCARDCEDLALRAEKRAPGDTSSEMYLQQPVFFPRPIEGRSFYRRHQHYAARDAIDSLKTIVILS